MKSTLFSLKPNILIQILKHFYQSFLVFKTFTKKLHIIQSTQKQISSIMKPFMLRYQQK